MSLGLLAGIKTFFTTASVGTKIAVVAGGAMVAAGAVAAPIVIVANNATNSDVSNHPVVNGEVMKDEKLDPIWTDEENKWCYDTMQYQVANNGLAPAGTTRDEISSRCSGDKGKDPRPDYSSETVGGALQKAYMAKYNANGKVMSAEEHITMPWVTPEERAWYEAGQQVEQICRGNNLMSQECRDAQNRSSKANEAFAALPSIYLPEEEWVTEEMKSTCSYNEMGLWKFWTCPKIPE